MFDTLIVTVNFCMCQSLPLLTRKNRAGLPVPKTWYSRKMWKNSIPSDIAHVPSDWPPSPDLQFPPLTPSPQPLLRPPNPLRRGLPEYLSSCRSTDG